MLLDKFGFGGERERLVCGVWVWVVGNFGVAGGGWSDFSWGKERTNGFFYLEIKRWCSRHKSQAAAGGGEVPPRHGAQRVE